MDLFILLGIFPLVTNIMMLLKLHQGSNFIEYNESQKNFIKWGYCVTFIWLIWGLFTNEWKIVVLLLLINTTIFKGLNLRFKLTAYESAVQFINNWFNLITISYILLDRADCLYLVFNFFKNI